MNNPDKLPPCNLDLERKILGSPLLVPDVLDDLQGVLEPEDFHGDAHRIVYRHLLAMHAAGEPIGETLLVEKLRAAGELDAVGGIPFVLDLVDSVAIAAEAPRLALIVKAHAQRRSLLRVVERAIPSVHDLQNDPVIMCGKLEAELRAIADGGPVLGLVDTEEAVSQIKTRLRDLREGRRRVGLNTGLADVDSEIGGMFPQELIILAARTRVGKTALAVQISAHCAHRGRKVLYVTCEMAAVELAMRIACSRARVDANRLRTGFMADRDYDAIEQAADEIQNVFYLDRPGVTVADVRRQARQVQRQHGLGLLVVDYLTLLRPVDPRAKRYEQVGQMTRDLKQLARELDVPILCLAQLSRAAEASGDGRPRLSHLRESGDIEQDADQVWFLHRPELHGGDPDTAGKAELIVEKNRAGRMGVFDLEWNADSANYRTPAKPDEYSGMFSEEGSGR